MLAHRHVTLPILARGSAASMRGRGRLLHHLLVAALQRAVAFAEVHDIAEAVGDHLQFDVPRRLR